MAMQVQKFEKKYNAEKKKIEMLEEYKKNIKKLENKSPIRKDSELKTNKSLKKQK